MSSSSVNSVNHSIKRKHNDVFPTNPDLIDKEGSTLQETPCKMLKMLPTSPLCALIGGIYNKQTSDIVFIFNENGCEQAVPAHKCILASDSTVFHRLFYNQPRQPRHLEISGVSIEICHGAYLIETKEFGHCSRETVKIVLSVDFFGRDEFKVVEALVKWTQKIDQVENDGESSILTQWCSEATGSTAMIDES